MSLLMLRHLIADYLILRIHFKLFNQISRIHHIIQTIMKSSLRFNFRPAQCLFQTNLPFYSEAFYKFFT